MGKQIRHIDPGTPFSVDPTIVDVASIIGVIADGAVTNDPVNAGSVPVVAGFVNSAIAIDAVDADVADVGVDSDVTADSIAADFTADNAAVDSIAVPGPVNADSTDVDFTVDAIADSTVIAELIADVMLLPMIMLMLILLLMMPLLSILPLLMLLPIILLLPRLLLPTLPLSMLLSLILLLMILILLILLPMVLLLLILYLLLDKAKSEELPHRPSVMQRMRRIFVEEVKRGERESDAHNTNFIGKYENGEVFGASTRFPTDRKPCNVRRAIDRSTPIGLSERYVQLITFSLRTFLNQYPLAIRTWDVYLSGIVHTLNCRTVKVLGHTPSQLLIGFNPTRQIEWDLNPESEIRLGELETCVQGVTDSVYPLPSAPDPELCIAALDEVRQTALDRLFEAK